MYLNDNLSYDKIIITYLITLVHNDISVGSMTGVRERAYIKEVWFLRSFIQSFR